MAYTDIEDSRMYKRAEKVADAVWDLVDGWKYFEKKTVGDQLVRSCDSIGANLAESAGRFHKNDVIKFIYYSRGSLRETKYWIKRAKARDRPFHNSKALHCSKRHAATPDGNSGRYADDG